MAGRPLHRRRDVVSPLRSSPWHVVGSTEHADLLERAALSAAIKAQKIARSKAVSAERKAVRGIERLTARLESLP